VIPFSPSFQQSRTTAFNLTGKIQQADLLEILNQALDLQLQMFSIPAKENLRGGACGSSASHPRSPESPDILSAGAAQSGNCKRFFQSNFPNRAFI